MNLFEEIRDGCVNSDTDLPSTLRKAKILASKLKHDELKDWIHNELSGYAGKSKIPDYRKLSSNVFGDLSGRFGKKVKNATIPTYNFPDTLKEFADNLIMVQGIRELQTMAKNKKGFKKRWPAEALMLAREKVEINSNYVLVDLWQPISTSDIEGIFDTVRNKLLDFLLELEAIEPKIIESYKSLSNISPEKVNNVFNFTIEGDYASVSSGSNFSQTVNHNITENDLESLVQYLKQLGIEENDLSDLKENIKKDGKRDNKKLGKNTKNWFSKMIDKSIDGIWNIGITVAPKLLMEAFSQYYGWK